MINGDTKCRVYNQCIHDIGVKLPSGISWNIKPNSFQILSVNDILFIESNCNTDKYFSKKMLVPIDSDGKSINLNEIGLYSEEEADVNLAEDEIASILKQNAKKLESWINDINDPVKLHSIYEVAVTLDLPSSKIKILKAKMPDKDWLDER